MTALATQLQVTDRPVTQQGLGGPKTAGVRGRLLYFSCRTKIREGALIVRNVWIASSGSDQKQKSLSDFSMSIALKRIGILIVVIFTKDVKQEKIRTTVEQGNQ